GDRGWPRDWGHWFGCRRPLGRRSLFFFDKLRLLLGHGLGWRWWWRFFLRRRRRHRRLWRGIQRQLHRLGNIFKILRRWFFGMKRCDRHRSTMESERPGNCGKGLPARRRAIEKWAHGDYFGEEPERPASAWLLISNETLVKPELRISSSM